MILWAKRLIFHWVLLPLVLHDYRLREAGKRPDRLYWADYLVMKWGFVKELDAAYKLARIDW